MKNTRQTIGRLKQIQGLVPVLIIGALILTGAVIYNFSARAATAGFHFGTSATSYKVGDTVQLGVYVNTESQCTNVVQADFTYPSNLLEYKSINASGSKFESTIEPGGSYAGGEISIVQYTTRKECAGGTTSGVSGDQLIANVTFTVKAAGTAALNFENSSIAVSSTDNSSNVAPGATGASLALSASTSPTPPPPAPTPPPAQPGPVNPTPVTSVKPRDATTGIPLTNNDSVKITTPVTVQPYTVQPDGISKIEYLIDDKVVYTATQAPYTYNLDTTKLLNGKYTLTTKTYYANGQTKSVNQTVHVANPPSWQQVKLRIQKSAWLIILGVIVLGAALLALIIHRRSDGPSDYYGTGGLSSGGDSPAEFVAPVDGNVVAPTHDDTSETDAEEILKSRSAKKAKAAEADEALHALAVEPGKDSAGHKIKLVEPIKR